MKHINQAENLQVYYNLKFSSNKVWEKALKNFL